MNKFFRLTMILLLMAPVFSLHAKPVDRPNNVDCSKTTLQSAIDKLDKSTVNSLDILGNCTEDIVVAGFADLTLTGIEGASITATSVTPEDPGNTTALLVEHSKLTVQTLTINGGDYGVWCGLRSICVFSDAIIQDGHNGLLYTDQSRGEILGSTQIRNSLGTGLGVYGASSVNVRPVESWAWGDEAGPVISGHGYLGAAVFDGSFLRTDNAIFSGNDYGIWAHRNAVIKIYGGTSGGVINSVYDAISVDYSSTAGIGVPVTGNGGPGIWIGPLSSVQDQGVTFSGNNGGGADVVCDHPTAISQPPSWCGH